MNKDITQKRLKEVLDYNPETGIFTWVKPTNWSIIKNKTAGYKDPKGYIKIQIDNIIYFAHRLAWFYVYGYFPENQIDHKNRIKDANWVDNLREVTNKCNARNRKIQSNNTSGITGVYWYKKYQTWVSKIKNNQKNIHLGYFENFKDAVNARWEAEKIYKFPSCNTTSSAYLYLKKDTKL